MKLTLDSETEARIQRKLARGRVHDAAELLSYALDLVEADGGGDWLWRNRDEIRRQLEESMAESERGEGYSPEEAKALLAERGVARPPEPLC